MKMSSPRTDAEFAESLLLGEFAAEREEILRHKWLQSEKAQRDIGFENALMEWILRHRSAWLEHRRRMLAER
jgi:hypothetical protein